MINKNFILGISSLVMAISCNSSGDIIGMDEINLNGPHQIIHTMSTAGSNNKLTFSVGGNKFVKLSDLDNTVLHQISYSNNKISNITGFYKDPITGVQSDFNLSFVYNNNVLTTLQGTEATAGVTSDVHTDFTYTNGKLTKTFTTKTTQGGTPVVTYTQSDLSYTGYNLSQSIFTSGTMNGNIPVPAPGAFTTTYTGYDSKVSYLYGLPKEYAYFSTYYPTGLNLLSPNNAQIETKDINGVTTTKNIAYIYGNSAMPTTSTENGTVTSYTYQAWNN